MNEEFNKQAASIANSSGFPLQIRIANIAESTKVWGVFLEEHPWKSDVTGSEGFIDLVLIKNRVAMVIECKRVRETKWVFLIPNSPNPEPSQHYRARPWESLYSDGKWSKFGWSNQEALPSSYESQFCAIPGTGQGRKTLLERTSAELIEATEALALQENEHVTGGHLSHRIYIPIIVTTAELVISSFEPGSISLRDGCLPQDSDFENVPFVRFSKTLTTQYGISHRGNIQDTHELAKRTVFIVNAENFEQFLVDWKFRRDY
jgi:hypothetical protein